MGLVYRVVLGELGASDVVTREVHVAVDDVETVYNVAASVGFIDLPAIAENQRVLIKVRDTDDAGNVGDWSLPYKFDTKDTIRPGMPGAVSVQLLEEVADQAPSPAPAPEPEVTPAPPEPVDNEEEDTVLNVDLPPPTDDQ